MAKHFFKNLFEQSFMYFLLDRVRVSIRDCSLFILDLVECLGSK